MIKLTKSTIKKTTSAILVALFVLVRTPLLVQTNVAFGQTAPTAPEAPSAPSAPGSPTAPEAPEAPTSPDAPEAPLAPEAPTSPYDEPDSTEAPSAPSTSSDSDGNQESPGTTQSTEQDGQPEGTSNTENSEVAGESADGNVGDSLINTGDATTSVSGETNINENIAGNSGGGSGSVSVVNDDNGSGSDNDASVTIASNDGTTQDNSATVNNNMEGESDTGNNSASRNVGNSEIETGDANTSGTLVNSVNTNADGVVVAEFDIVDDHVGDIILDAGSSCTSGCLGDSAVIENTGNGSESDNNIDVNLESNDATFQENDATVENNMTLNADTGDNIASRNTGGDSTIATGDANVAASIVNMVNNNIAGGVVYMVVNIFGDLIGDIILPDNFAADCCGTDVTAANTGNGDGSTNNILVQGDDNDEISQFNTANIENNLIITAESGDNDTSRNTNGSSSIETGDTNVLAQVLNIANLNLVGGDYWLVIVNEAGQWVGKILGAGGDGNYAGSEILEFIVGENGAITVKNSGNGEGSTNTINIESQDNDTITQVNNANIVNNVNLSANTGGNSASRNTGGDSTITTGDASVVASIVNFVNNNIVGSGRLFVNVINVFGSWLGNFIAPGYQEENSSNPLASDQPGDTNGGGQESNNSVGGNSGSTSGASSGSSSQDTSSTSSTSGSSSSGQFGFVAYSQTGGGGGTASESFDNGIVFPEEIGQVLGEGASVGVQGLIDVNYKWFIVLIPAYFMIAILRRRLLIPA